MHPPGRRDFPSTGIPLGSKAFLGVRTGNAWHPLARMAPFVYGKPINKLMNLWCCLVIRRLSIGRNGIPKGLKSQPPATMEPFDFGIQKREKYCKRFEAMP